MIARICDWCGRNVETVIWFNVLLLILSALEQILENNWYPLGLCSILVGLMLILKK